MSKKKKKKLMKKKMKNYEHEKAIAKQWELDEELAMKKVFPDYEIEFDPEGVEGLIGLEELEKEE